MGSSDAETPTSAECSWPGEAVAPQWAFPLAVEGFPPESAIPALEELASGVPTNKVAALDGRFNRSALARLRLGTLPPAKSEPSRPALAPGALGKGAGAPVLPSGVVKTNALAGAVRGLTIRN